MPKRFSWILKDHLAVGSFPHFASSMQLQDKGVTAVLSLTEPFEGELPPEICYNFVWHRIAIPDGYHGGVPLVSHFEEGVKVLEFWRQRKNAVFVHCYAGIGRSSSMCVAYVCRTLNLSYEQGLALVKAAHSVADPDENQERILKEFLQKCAPGSPSS